MKTSYVLRCLWNLFFPERCPVCGRCLSEGEQFICWHCMDGLPRLRVRDGSVPDVDELFAGCRIVDKSVAMFRYSRASCYSEILKDIKYRNRPQIARWLGRKFADELQPSGFFDGVDFIVPVPLHSSKRRKRGYNQVHFLAEGIAAVTGLPVAMALSAVRPHRSQTSRTVEERRRNVSGVFRADLPVEGKTVLLVDDVITTGATLTACADELSNAGAARVCVLALGMARL